MNLGRKLLDLTAPFVGRETIIGYLSMIISLTLFFVIRKIYTITPSTQIFYIISLASFVTVWGAVAGHFTIAPQSRAIQVHGLILLAVFILFMASLLSIVLRI